MELALAFPFSIGLVAAFNPCGFAMLPAYLSYFMGLDGGEADRSGDPAALLRNVVRAILVGLVLTAGFMVVFGTVGVLVNTVISQGFIFERVPYATVVFGVALIPLGIAMVAGFNPTVRLPKLNRGTGDRQLSSMFMFGVSYAIVSLSCTAPLFLTQVVGSFTSDGWVEGTATFLAYATGMGAVITFLTLSLALARTNVARNLRRVLPHITRISGVLLVAAGGYLITYGVWEIRILRGEATSNALVEWFEQLQFTVQNWVRTTTPERLGVVALFAVLGALLLGWRAVESDVVRRRSVTTAYVGAYLVVEFAFNRADFLVGPTLRLLTGWPTRVPHWFTDPWRWGVLGEVAVTGALVWWLARHLIADAGTRPATDTDEVTSPATSADA